jgi:hypothetical protein
VNDFQGPAMTMLLVVKVTLVGVYLRHGSSPVACSQSKARPFRPTITSQFR